MKTCVMLCDENFWFGFVLLIVCLMVACRRGDDKILFRCVVAVVGIIFLFAVAQMNIYMYVK